MNKNKCNKKYIIILVSLFLLSAIGFYKYIQQQNQLTIEEFFSFNKVELSIMAEYLIQHKSYKGIAYKQWNLLKYIYNQNDFTTSDEIICNEKDCTWEEKILLESIKKTEVHAYIFLLNYVSIWLGGEVYLENGGIFEDVENFVYRKWYFKDKKEGEKIDDDRYLRIKTILNDDWAVIRCISVCE